MEKTVTLSLANVTARQDGRPCPVGWWGVNCLETCDCNNGATCDHMTGQCKCLAGFRGYRCKNECPLGTYGVDCTEACKCKNGGTCSPISGRCTCAEGWLGDDCSEPACPDNKFGPNCAQLCSCITDHCARTCARTTGTALFAPWSVTAPTAWGVTHRLESVSVSLAGEGCDVMPPVQTGGTASTAPRRVAVSTLVPAVTRRREFARVDQVTTAKSQYLCKVCEKPCENGIHGTQCRFRCSCVWSNTEGGCDPETSECFCKPGYRGVNCESRCHRGRYGENCSRSCDCKNDGSCHPETGKCQCERGWSGTDCQSPCLLNYYGSKCNQNCPPCVHRRCLA
ncbi:hypothetical protein HAZT_HAZT011793 [Hyalella azteca]|uniref:EGF-like domain-containing protein n=1 Tax=Hyalella azteca TaxID=294128 RepID=A0A6A0GZQ9_HYAAZ|nr:hypothetical protein HAZT_HAZT011793 [Hyalella azteca]